MTASVSGSADDIDAVLIEFDAHRRRRRHPVHSTSICQRPQWPLQTFDIRHR